jgi:predicted NBD/HSP70 family sugar kinase
MEHYVGLDVSLKLTAICIVDQTGKIEREGVVPSDPEARVLGSRLEQRRLGFGPS